MCAEGPLLDGVFVMLMRQNPFSRRHEKARTYKRNVKILELAGFEPRHPKNEKSENKIGACGV